MAEPFTEPTATKPALTELARSLREKHETFHYRSCSVSPDSQGLRLDYSFSITPNLTFTPHIIVPLLDTATAPTLASLKAVRRLTFLIGMVELLSYWKLCCAPRIEIEAGHLDSQELAYWEHLIRFGLGEFFFRNQISPALKFSIVCSSSREAGDEVITPHPKLRNDSRLILVGGGKDSVVTLEVLKQFSNEPREDLVAFSLNPIQASIDAVRAAHYPKLLVGQRTIDPLVRELNNQGYLNGHTPFSALLAFLSVLTAYSNGYQTVLASNESSASEGNTEVAGFEINHQYSKSFEFEQRFREYISRLQLPVEYVSFLRPLNELQICALFSKMEHQHQIFRSCNREQTLIARSRAHQATLYNSKTSEPESDKLALPRSGWCACCPKCVFTFLSLRGFLSSEEVQKIFGVDPSAMPEFAALISELAGFSEHKPFECVGTFEEVRSCLAHIIKEAPSEQVAEQDFISIRKSIGENPAIASATPIDTLIHRWNPEHFLDKPLEAALRAALLSVQRSPCS